MTTQTVIFEALLLPTTVKLVPWGGGTAITCTGVAVAGGNRDGYYKANATGVLGRYHLIAYDSIGSVLVDDTITMGDVTNEQYVDTLVGLDAATIVEMRALLAGFEGYSLLEIVRIGIAVLAGKSSGATPDGGVIKFKSLDNATDRVTANCDGFGNRTSVAILAD